MFDRYPIKICTNDSGNRVSSILLIYTGGTLGMAYDKQGRILQPFDFQELLEKVPELNSFDLELHIISLDRPIDSSNMQPAHWLNLANLIGRTYNEYDGFVILHGTDTMAYTASALSYLLEGLNKPVILTGAQLPLGVARTDARENIITSIEIASAKNEGVPILSEVAIYFDSFLLRGNRSKKVQSSHFNAFVSENYPPLGEAGAEMEYNRAYLAKYGPKALRVHGRLCDDVAIIQLFPGLSPKIIESILNIEEVKAIVLETYGSGNAPDNSKFLNSLEKAIQKGKIIFNVSQCMGGRVIQGKYQNSRRLQEMGVVSGSNITTEAAITKLMFVLGNYDRNLWEKTLATPICGEMD